MQSSPQGSFNGTITVYDTDAKGAPTHIASDDYNASGLAVCNYLNDPNTTASVWSGTNLFLDLFNQSNRTLHINADDPLPGSPAGPAPGKIEKHAKGGRFHLDRLAGADERILASPHFDVFEFENRRLVLRHKRVHYDSD